MAARYRTPESRTCDARDRGGEPGRRRPRVAAHGRSARRWARRELLDPLAGLPDVHPTATLTEAALLSGTPKRETGVDRKWRPAPDDGRLRDHRRQGLRVGPVA
ncbi:MAG: hypothetical protein WKF78_06395 [Candidatus Limnocylindrales bacterium]